MSNTDARREERRPLSLDVLNDTELPRHTE